MTQAESETVIAQPVQHPLPKDPPKEFADDLKQGWAKTWAAERDYCRTGFSKKDWRAACRLDACLAEACVRHGGGPAPDDFLYDYWLPTPVGRLRMAVTWDGNHIGFHCRFDDARASHSFHQGISGKWNHYFTRKEHLDRPQYLVDHVLGRLNLPQPEEAVSSAR